MKKLLFVTLVAFTLPAALYGCDNHKDISSEDAQELILSDKNLIVLDVRTAAEFAAGHLPNAINIDVNDDTFKERLQALDKNKDYLVYCFVGIRSLKASKIMQEAGFQKIYNLEDGMKAWKGPVQ